MASQRSSVTIRRHPTLGVAGRLLVVAALAFGWLLSASPAGAQEDGLDGDTYTDAEYGWSVEFDDDAWEAEVTDGELSPGLTLNTDGFAVIASLFPEPSFDDPETCLDSLEDVFRGGSEWDDFAPARGLDAPETDPDALGGVYTVVLTTDDGSGLDVALYLECRQLAEGTLSIAVSTVEGDFEDNIPLIENLLAGIAIDDASPQDPNDDGPSPNGPVNRDDEPTPEEDPTEQADDPTEQADDPTEEPEEETSEVDPPSLDHEPADQLGARDDGTLDDGSYRSEVGYALTWDADVYEGRTGDDPGAGVLLENAETGATVELAAFEDPEIEDCITAEVQRILQSPDYVSAAASNGVRPPTSDDEAVGRMLRATEDTTQQPRKIIYVECRPLLDEGDDGDPVFLVVRAASDDEDFRASRPEFEKILAAITIGDEPAPTPTEEPEAEPTRKPTREATEEPDEEPTPKPRRTPTAEPDDAPADLGETDIPGGLFVGARVPFKVEWDTAYWNVEEIIDQGVEGITLSSADPGAFGSILSLNTPPDYDMEACLTGFIESWVELTPDLAQIEPEPAAQLDLPEGSSSLYGVGTVTAENGNTATVIHSGGCLELDGGGFLLMQVQIFEPVYAQNLAAFNEVLASIEFGSNDQVGGRPSGVDARAALAPEIHAAIRREAPAPLHR